MATLNGYNQHQLYHIVQQLHTISQNSSKGEYTTPYDKYHIQSPKKHSHIFI
jgi:hypothetical protein